MKTKSKGTKILLSFLMVVLIGLLVFLWKWAPIMAMMMGKSFYLFPPSAERYGKDALKVMAANGLYKNSEAWPAACEKAELALKDAADYQAAHEILEEALKVAGGKHSFLSPEPLAENNKNTEITLPKISRDGDVLTLHLPSYLGTDAEGQAYADALAKALKTNDDAKGVILDLRDNNGGDMGPMIAGLAPILPDGELMYFLMGEKKLPVTLQTGQVMGGGTPTQVDIGDFKLQVPVAILVGPQTKSSGEAVFIAFKGLDDVKSFGAPTGGYASANSIYPLYDGAQMVLTIAQDMARTGEIFAEDSLLPDVATKTPEADALLWLQEK